MAFTGQAGADRCILRSAISRSDLVRATILTNPSRGCRRLPENKNASLTRAIPLGIDEPSRNRIVVHVVQLLQPLLLIVDAKG
jgi:hypothetical protein